MLHALRKFHLQRLRQALRPSVVGWRTTWTWMVSNIGWCAALVPRQFGAWGWTHQPKSRPPPKKWHGNPEMKVWTIWWCSFLGVIFRFHVFPGSKPEMKVWLDDMMMIMMMLFFSVLSTHYKDAPWNVRWPSPIFGVDLHFKNDLNR